MSVDTVNSSLVDSANSEDRNEMKVAFIELNKWRD